MTRFTKRNHYNPCFWTALWCSGSLDRPPRERPIHTLNIRANKMLQVSVESVHFVKHLGVAEITPTSMRAFCRRWFPDRYAAFCKAMEGDDRVLFIDFEDILHGLESSPAYRVMLEIAGGRPFQTIEDKSFVAGFIVLQALRSQEAMSTGIANVRNMGGEKFEYFWLLKNAISNEAILGEMMTPIVYSQWIVRRSSVPLLPLCDSPILANSKGIMVALSPYLLLEVNGTIVAEPDRWIEVNGISKAKQTEFRRRSIDNTFRDVVFCDSWLLDEWRNSVEYRGRVKLLQDPQAYEACIDRAADRLECAIGGFGKSLQSRLAEIERRK